MEHARGDAVGGRAEGHNSRMASCPREAAGVPRRPPGLHARSCCRLPCAVRRGERHRCRARGAAACRVGVNTLRGLRLHKYCEPCVGAVLRVAVLRQLLGHDPRFKLRPFGGSSILPNAAICCSKSTGCATDQCRSHVESMSHQYRTRVAQVSNQRRLNVETIFSIRCLGARCAMPCHPTDGGTTNL